MTNDQQSAESFRLRAEALRTLADMDVDAKNRDTLCGIAESYERIAGAIEAINRSKSSLKA